MEQNKECAVIDVHWQDKDEAIKIVMDFEKRGVCEIDDIHSYDRDGTRVTSFYLKNCDRETWFEIERFMKEDGIRVM